MRRFRRVTVVIVMAALAWSVFAGAAGGATTYQFLREQMWRAPQDNPVELGLLLVRIEPLLDGGHAALFALPKDFSLVPPNNTPSIEDPSVTMTIRPTAANEFLGEIRVPGIIPKATFLIPIQSAILSARSGDIEITITHLDGQLPSGVVVAGQVLPGEVTIQSGRVESIADGKSAVEITFRENMAGLLRKGSPIKLTLPEGFGWANAKGTLVSGEGLEVRPLVDGRVLELRTERESTRRTAFRVEAEVRVTDAAKAGAGEVRAKVEGLRDLSAGTILVAHYRAPEPEPKPLPKPEPKPEPVVSRTVVFTIGNDRYTSNGVTARMDVVPYLKDGRTYLPLRYVALSLGLGPGDIKWDGAARRAVLTGHGVTVQVTVGSRLLLVDGMKVEIDAAPELVPPGRIMLPYRSIAEAFGARVDWDGATRTVTMTR